MELELVADYQCVIGENPLWHVREQRLYWTDSPTARMFRYDPRTQQHEEFFNGKHVSGFTFQADGGLLLFMDRGAIATWHDGKLKYIVQEIAEERESTFNDVIADPLGRVFCGTVASARGLQPGRLYRLNTDGSLHKLVEGIQCSNGMGFSRDLLQFYYTDSLLGNIYVFDYDVVTGELSNQRVWMHIPERDGLPDGMTVDAEGCIWSARWNDGAVYRHSPDGSLIQRIAIPAKKVTSVTLGGPRLDDLYITTALYEGTREELGAGSGALFRMHLGVRGVPEFLSRVNLAAQV